MANSTKGAYWLPKGAFEATKIPVNTILGVDRVGFQTNEAVEAKWSEREDWRTVAGFVKTTKSILPEEHPKRCLCPACMKRI